MEIVSRAKRPAEATTNPWNSRMIIGRASRRSNDVKVPNPNEVERNKVEHNKAKKNEGEKNKVDGNKLSLGEIWVAT